MGAEQASITSIPVFEIAVATLVILSSSRWYRWLNRNLSAS